jgi:hypothetical protein
VTVSAEDLERKVQQRTHEVVAAKEEITVKAQQLRALLARIVEQGTGHTLFTDHVEG